MKAIDHKPTTEKPPHRIEELSKDELNLAEYPLGLIAERLPAGFKTIEYTDWVHIEGEKRELRWVVTGSDRYGLPTGADQDVLVVLMHLARKQGFKDKTIAFGSAYNLLQLLGWDWSAKSYRRLKKGLDRWVGLTIYAQNAFWDKRRQRYVSHQSFHIFDSYHLLERYSPGRRKTPLALGYIVIGDYFWRSIQAGNIKDLDLALYRRLPSPLTKRLYRFLDKKRWYGRPFSMACPKLCKKLGFAGPAVDKYYPSQIRRMLGPALRALKAEGFVETFTFRHGKHDDILRVEFTGAGESLPRATLPASLPLHEHQKKILERIENHYDYLVAQILDVTGDEHSRAYYKQVVRDLAEPDIWELLSETKQAKAKGAIRTTPGRFFTDLAQRRLGRKTS